MKNASEKLRHFTLLQQKAPINDFRRLKCDNSRWKSSLRKYPPWKSNNCLRKISRLCNTNSWKNQLLACLSNCIKWLYKMKIEKLTASKMSWIFPRIMKNVLNRVSIQGEIKVSPMTKSKWKTTLFYFHKWWLVKWIFKSSEWQFLSSRIFLPNERENIFDESCSLIADLYLTSGFY